jgi:hypothetical protein
MGNRLKCVFALLIGVVIGGTAGFFFGAQAGVWEFFLLDSSAKASLLTYELRALRAGETGKIILSKEIELDGDVVNFAHFLEEGHPWVLWPAGGYRDHDKFMRQVALYREAYPPVTPAVEIKDDNPIQAELRAYHEEVSRRTKEMIERYGK